MRCAAVSSPCQGAFLLKLHAVFSSAYESCIILLADSVDGHECVQLQKRSMKRSYWSIDHVVVSSFWIIIIGRVCTSADFLSVSSMRRRWISLAGVNLRNGESQDSLLKRFRKKVVKSGVLSTVRRKRWFVSKSEQRRMEKKKAIRRIKRRTFTRDGE